jgi:hypothetical protein
VPFEALYQAESFRKGLLQGRRRVGIEIILDQDDGVGAGELNVRQVLEHVCKVDGRPALGHLHVPAILRAANTTNRLAVPLRVLVIEPRLTVSGSAAASVFPR